MARPKKNDTVQPNTLISTAASLFAERGYHGTSMREIAKAAGVNMATISYHFGSKEGLYNAVFKELAENERGQYQHFVEGLSDSIFHDSQKFRQATHDLLDLYIQASTGSPLNFQLWNQYSRDFPQKTRIIAAEYDLPIFEMIVHLFERARDNRIIAPKTENLRMIVSVITSMVSRFCEKQFLDMVSGEDLYGIERVDDLKNFLVLYWDLMSDFQL